MKIAALGLALVLALPAAAAAQEYLPPPPPPPTDDLPATPPPRPARRPAYDDQRPAPPRRTTTAEPRTAPPNTIGEGPVAAAGSIGAPLHPDLQKGNWRYSLATGVVGRFGGFQLHTDQSNSGLLLYVGGQADGLWDEGTGRAVRLRTRVFTGGERIVFLPSDGEIEAAFMLGRPEFRFVMGRVEVARYTGLALQTLAQASTLPSFEGSIPMAGDKVRFFYSLSPVELAWVAYYGRAHITHSAALATETDHPDAASSFRARVTFDIPPSVLLSLQGDFLKFWGSADMLVATEGSVGVAVLDRSVLLNVSARWESFTRRDTIPGATASADQFLGMAAATLVF